MRAIKTTIISLISLIAIASTAFASAGPDLKTLATSPAGSIWISESNGATVTNTVVSTGQAVSHCIPFVKEDDVDVCVVSIAFQAGEKTTIDVSWQLTGANGPALVKTQYSGDMNTVIKQFQAFRK